MSTTKASNSEDAYVIDSNIDADGTLTVRQVATGAEYDVVDFADRLVREKVATRAVGSTVRLALAPTDADDSEWVITRLLPGAPIVAH